MKKIYQSPTMNVVKISARNIMQQASPTGVETGGKPNNVFSEGDISYGRRGSSLWGDDDDE